MDRKKAQLPKNTLNPNGYWLISAMNSREIRYVLMQGGSSSAKSFSFAQVCLLITMIDHENTIVLRKVGASISRTIYEDFKINALKKNEEMGANIFKCTMNRITCAYGGKIEFTGLDDSEKIKGLSNYKRIFMDELTEFEESDWRQIRTRMRGKEGQQLYGAFNPITESHWIKRSVFDNETWEEQPMFIDNIKGISPELCKVKAVFRNKGKSFVNPTTGEIDEIPSNFLWIQSTYLNNFWVVGSPDGTYGYYDRQCIANYEYDKEHDPDYYRVYALGEWGVIRTGGEFLPKFSMQKVGKFPYNENLPVHVSVDNNVLPYITTTIWQYDINTKTVSQIAEVCAVDPENTASRAGELVAEYLHSLGVEKVYLHGDVTTKAASTIDDEKRSFFDKYMEKLTDFDVEDCTGNSNPSVRASGEFMNALIDGWGGFSFGVDESCKHSIEDYLSVKKDVNGGLLKIRVKDTVTKQSYEQYGHCCFTPDTLVRTKKGNVPISRVKIGDFVICESGESIVYNAFKTCSNALFFVSLISGRENKLSYNHPIKTDRGFVPAYQLMEGDVVTLTDNERVWKEKLEHTTALGLFAIQMQNVIAIGSILRDGLKRTESSERYHSTGICGSVNVDRFLMGAMFIMLMVITITTHLITLPLLMVRSMKDIMRRISVKNMIEPDENHLTNIDIKPLNGTGVKKVVNGIENMAAMRWLKENLKNLYVRCVEHLTGLLTSIQDFVHRNVEPRQEERVEWTMRSVLVRFVALNLWSIGTLVQSIVQSRVPLKIGGISDLYDLSTDSHTFFANGVLVHNCDTARYFICDVLKNEYADYSLRRKHNTHTELNYIKTYEAKDKFTFIIPSFDDKASLIVLARVGDVSSERLVVEKAIIRDSMDAETISSMIEGTPVFESEKPFFDLGRKLREKHRELSIRSPKTDADERIKATAPLMENVYFIETDDAEYLSFLDNLQDYNGRESRHASNIMACALQYLVRH